MKKFMKNNKYEMYLLNFQFVEGMTLALLKIELFAIPL